MKKTSLLFLISGMSLLMAGCQNSSNAVWEDTKTMGRYLHRQGRLLWNKDVDSKMIANADEFTGPTQEDYIPLKDEDLKLQYADNSIPQPSEEPGGKGSQIPGIEHFKDPSYDFAQIFKTLYFNTNEHVLRAQEHYKSIEAIATNLKKNSDLYIFVMGNCDERASEDYNLALGTRRANTVRLLLIKKGIESNRIYTISYGKEMPVDRGHTPEAWAKNRRVEFKIFEKK